MEGRDWWKLKKTSNFTGLRVIHGFTMVELMITLAVAAIMLALSVPSLKRITHNNLLVTSSNDLSASLSHARAEALKARRNVRICPTSNNTSCSTSSQWADGWLMFVDLDGNSLPQASELIELGAALDGRVSLTASTAFQQWIQFRPSGAAIGSAGNSGSFSVCSGDYPEISRLVGISAVGRVTTKKDANLCVADS